MRPHAFVSRLTLASVLGVATLVMAQEGPPAGKVWVESKSVALGVRVSWGDGKLTYQGKEHPFTVSGLSVVDLGISRVTTTGEVFNLKQLSDFAGTYVAGQAAVGGGAGASVMKNQHGVVMKLTGTGNGGQLTLAGKGVEVKLKN